jgi:hypothetical protein
MSVMDEGIWSNGEMIVTGNNQSIPSKTCLSVTFPTKNPTGTEASTVRGRQLTV